MPGVMPDGTWLVVVAQRVLFGDPRRGRCSLRRAVRWRTEVVVINRHCLWRVSRRCRNDNDWHLTVEERALPAAVPFWQLLDTEAVESPLASADDDPLQQVGMWHDLLLGCLERIANACETEPRSGNVSRACTDLVGQLRAAVDDVWHEIGALETARQNASAGAFDPMAASWIATASTLVGDLARNVVAATGESKFRHRLEAAVKDLELVAHNASRASSVATRTRGDHARHDVSISADADSLALPKFSISNRATLDGLKDPRDYDVGKYLCQLVTDHNSWVDLARHWGITHLGELPARVLQGARRVASGGRALCRGHSMAGGHESG